MSTVFVVSEGETDYEVLRAVITEVGRENATRVKVKALFPGNDANKENGGWDNLRQWCRRQAATLAGDQQRARAAMLLGARSDVTVVQRQYDKITAALRLQSGGPAVIVVQLDTDTAEDYIADGGALDYSHPLNRADRERIGTAAIANWLGGHSAKIGGAIRLCVATYATETFLLATYDRATVKSALKARILPEDYDSIPVPELALVELGHASYLDGDTRRLRKRTPLYRSYSERLTNNLIAARANSSSLNLICSNFN